MSSSRQKRALLLGAGGWAKEHWVDCVWPDFKDRVNIVGLVDSEWTLALKYNHDRR